MGIEKRHELFLGGKVELTATFECQGCGDSHTVEVSKFDFQVHPASVFQTVDVRPTVEISVQCPVCFTPHIVEFPA